MSKLISIIVPTFNNERHIKRCLTSILEQNYKNIEVIVINDGSTDGTQSILDKIAKNDKRLIVFYQGNKGVSSARNKGLELVKGKYIGFVDADDIVKSDMFQILYENIINYDTDISHCGYELVKNKKIIKFYGTNKFLLQKKHEGLKALLSGKFIEPSVCNKLYKKDVLNDIYFNDKIEINEDLLFNVEAFSKAKKSIYLDRTLYQYIENIGSVSHTKVKIRELYDVYKTTKLIKERLINNIQIKQDVDKFYVNKVITLLKSIYLHKIKKDYFYLQLKKDLNHTSWFNYGFRVFILKFILLKIPSVYIYLQRINNIIFRNKHRWS